jgi:purine catabolism regulator
LCIVPHDVAMILRMQSVPSVSLSEILQLSLPAGSRLLSGQGELGRRVHWARLLRARPTNLGTVEPGELLLLTAGLLDSLGEPRVSRRLITELVEAGVAAFVLSGDPHESLVEACEAHGTPLFQVPDDVPLPEVERAIVGLILDRDAQLRRRADEVYDRLLATMLGNAGLPALVEALSEATGLCAAVFDDYLTLQACAPDDESLKHELQAAASELMSPDSSPRAPRRGRPRSLRFLHGETHWGGQLYPLEIGSAWAGHLGLLSRSGGAGELERLLAERASTLVALELAKQRAVSEATQRWRRELLDDLLEGSFPTNEALLARARQLGYDLMSPHLAFVLSADQADEAGPLSDNHPAAGRQRRRFPEVARTVLLRLEPRALAAEREGALIALVPFAAAADVPAACALAERVRAATVEALPDIRVSAGLGRAVLQPRDFADAQAEAQKALGIAQKLLGGGCSLHYAQLGIERLLLHLLGHPELEQFARDLVGDLLSYDALHHAQLVRTLEVFLRCNGNHVRAAQELHLHRNTLLYRLERIRQILGRDLEEADTRLALQVALRVRGLIAKAAPLAQPTITRVAGRRRRAG